MRTRICSIAAAVVVAGCAPAATVSITSPHEGDVVATAATITLHIEGDPDTLSAVVVNAGDTKLKTLDREALFASSDIDVAWDASSTPGGAVTLSATAFDGSDNVTSTASVDVTVRRGPSLPVGGEGEAGGEGEGDVVVGEGEGDVVVGEGEGDADVVDPNWTPPPAHPFAQLTSFPANPAGDASAPNPGNLAMYLHVPANMPPHAPVVVALHGCSQDASQFMTTSGWTKLADRYKFYVIFPQQSVTPEHDASKTGNPVRCFNWAGYYGERMARGEGENESIREMVALLVDDAAYAADGSRVFATGLSAGGAMVPLLLATWPDIFAAGAPMAGVPFACADDVNSAIACMHGDATRRQTPAVWGDRVRAAAPAGFAGPWPRLQVWQGDADNTVSYANMQELVDQWTNVHGVSATPGDTTPLKSAARKSYGGVVETITLHGMDHGISIDPGTGTDQGGGAGAYAYDKDVYSSYYAAKFFGIVDDDVTSGGEGEGDVASPDPACVEYTSTVVMHEVALPARVKNVGTFAVPAYEVVGSGEPIDASVNPYLDDVTVHSTGDATFALGSCP